MTQSEAHEKVVYLLSINQYTQVEIGELLSKTPVTIHHRVKKGNWRQKEINIIKDL